MNSATLPAGIMIGDAKNWAGFGTAYPFYDLPIQWVDVFGGVDLETAAIGPEDYHSPFIDIDNDTGPRFRHQGDKTANFLIADGHGKPASSASSG